MIQFSIKPRLCVLTKEEEVCRDELEIRWVSEEVRSLCLYQSEEAHILRCWENETEGSYQFQITATASINFYLRESEAGLPLSREVFEVVHNQKSYRKQRRNPWSFF